MIRVFSVATLLGLFLLGICIDAADPVKTQSEAAAVSTVDFGRDVLPILKQNCFECHHQETREGGLRFFSRDDLLQLNDSGLAAIKEKDAGKSELIRRVSTDDELEKMPPEGDGLSQNQIDTLKTWIALGAKWPEELTVREAHWAYTAPIRPELPEVNNQEWCRNEIDRFILKRIEAAGLQPQQEAETGILLRRLYLDLIGIPPTVEQLDAYLSSSNPDKYAKQVDELLTSPHFGAKWARQWLDLARYADSNGYQADQFREIWPYRDWVIDSMNADKPFDQFTIEQLAGDLLPESTLEQKIATGFQRCTTCNVEAGVDPEENRVNQIVDRVNTTGTVWLGTTLECAQCHNHKYDPFTMKDYYSLFAFYNNTPLEVVLPDNKGVQFEVAGPKMPLPLEPEQQAKKDRLEAEKATLDEKLTSRKQVLAQQFDAFVADMEKKTESSPQWHVLKIASFKADPGEPKTEILKDASILLSGPNPDKTTYTVTLKSSVASITGFRLEALTHDSLPGKGPGRGDDQRPNFVLYEFDLMQQSSADSAEFSTVELHSARAEFSQKGWDVGGLIDGNNKTGWAINPQFGKSHRATFLTSKPLNPDGSEITLTVSLPQHLGAARTMGRMRFSAMTGDPGIERLSDDVRTALKIGADKRDKKQIATLVKYQLEQDPQATKLSKLVAKLQTELSKIQPITTLVLVEMDEQRETNIMKRGNFLDPGEVVSTAVPAILHDLPEETSNNRLGLAQWVVAPENPLVRRVAVNRWWGEIFGDPLVRTPEDFGTQGERPTHPLLLDWLADEFLQSGWSRKAILRKVVTSATYRQASTMTPELLEADPYNKLFARGSRFRLSAETIRDNALRISGLLSQEMGGPAIYPPQPDNIWRHVGRNAPKYATNTDEKRYRRGIYVVWRRSAPYPSFVNFDAPDRASCVVNRSRTNTPLQALTLMNDPAYVEMTRALAQKIVSDAPSADVESRLSYAFRSCTSREPTSDELTILRKIHDQERLRLAEDSAALEKLIPGKEHSSEEKRELVVWFYVATILLNLDETITKN